MKYFELYFNDEKVADMTIDETSVIVDGSDMAKSIVKMWLSNDHRWILDEGIAISGKGNSSEEMIVQSLLHIRLFDEQLAVAEVEGLEKGGKIGKTPVKRMVQGPFGTYYAIRWMGKKVDASKDFVETWKHTFLSNRNLLKGLINFRKEKDFTLDAFKNYGDKTWKDFDLPYGYRLASSDATGEAFAKMDAFSFLKHWGFHAEEIGDLHTVAMHDPLDAVWDEYSDANSYYVGDPHGEKTLILSWNYTPLAVLKGMAWKQIVPWYERESNDRQGFENLYTDHWREIEAFIGAKVKGVDEALIYLWIIRRMGRELPQEWLDRSHVLWAVDNGMKTGKLGRIEIPPDLPMLISEQRISAMAKYEATNFVRKLREDGNIQFVKNFLKVDLSDAPEDVEVNVLLQMRKLYDKLIKSGPKMDIYNAVTEGAAYIGGLGAMEEFWDADAKEIYKTFFGKLRDAKNYVDIINAIVEERKLGNDKLAEWQASSKNLSDRNDRIGQGCGVHTALADKAVEGLERIIGSVLWPPDWQKELSVGDLPKVEWKKIKEEEYAKLKNPVAETDAKLLNSMTTVMAWTREHVHPEMRTPISVELIATRPDIGGDCASTNVRITEASAEWFTDSIIAHEYGHAMDHALASKDAKTGGKWISEHSKGELVDDLFTAFYDWKTKGVEPIETPTGRTEPGGHTTYRRRPDKFISEYAGREYERWRDGKIQWVGGVELPSEGLERMYSNPGSFMLKDPVHFLLMYAFMNNDLVLGGKK